MIVHVLRALGQLLHPRYLWLLLKTFALTALLLGGLYAAGLWGAVTWIEGMADGAVGLFGDVVAGLVLLIAFVVIYLPVSAIVLSLFVEEAVKIVETRHYPATRGRREQSLAEALAVGLRFALVLTVLNLLALPFYILLPGINIVLFLVLNGYLSGREYFEMVAARHFTASDAVGLRRRFALRLFFAGVFIAAFLMIPVLNLIGPLFGAALMVHVFQDVARRGQALPVGAPAPAS